MERMSAAEFVKRYGGQATSRPAVQDAKPKKPAQALARRSEGEASRTELPLVRFTLRRVRLLDVDAEGGSCKDLLDGLQYAGLIHGDRKDQIRFQVDQQKVAHFYEEETIIEIEYP